MTGEHLDWDNLRYFLAVARAGKLTAAARRLGQDHTTVGRRIASLESAFRSKLFERRPEGYRLTETGQRLYENVKTLESSVWEIQRDLAGQTQQVEGVVRIGAPDDFGNLFLAKHIGELQSLHPGLKIELITLPYTLSVSKREADIAIGVERPAEGRLFVRRLTDFEMRLYATRDYIDAHGPIDRPSDLARQTWIGPVSDFNSTSARGHCDRARLHANAAIRMLKLRGATRSRDQRGGRRHASPLCRRPGKGPGPRSTGHREDDESLSHGGSRRSSGFTARSDGHELHRPKGDRGARAFRSFPHSFEPIQNPIASRLARSRGSYGRGGSSA